MSNSIGHNLLTHQNLRRPTATEYQNLFSSPGIPTNSLIQVQSQATKQARNSPISTKFWGKNLISPKAKLPMGIYRLNYVCPQAVLAADSTSELAGKFNLDENIELQVDVNPPTAGSILQLDFQVTNGGDPLVLHWGVICDSKEKWILPSCRPEGTSIYKNRALRTPFVKSGNKSSLRIEIDDPAIQAVEFLIFDEAHNKWFKNHGENFHVKLPRKQKQNPSITVPEDLVQVQAYLRWERKGKQMYTPDQEKMGRVL